ncbi:MAG: hypothetical protein M1813_005462 [Trichoglossum hirsutum]|nr:MAG: hypothetical protein M1813_005462 [Trichoglossum hirsutum]
MALAEVGAVQESPWICCNGDVCEVVNKDGAISTTTLSSLVSSAPGTSTTTATSINPTKATSMSTTTTISMGGTTAITPDGTTTINTSPTTDPSTSTMPHTTPNGSSTRTPAPSTLPTEPGSGSSSHIGTSTTSGSSGSHYSTGNLLVGTCATAEYTEILDDHDFVLFYVAVVGCISDKPDCCPAATVTQPPHSPPVSSDQYRFVGGSTSPIYLPSCPDDYETVSGVCCPRNFLLWNSILGGITPCVSTLSTYADPPPFTNIVTVTGIRATSTVANVVYAMQYPIKRNKSGLSKNKRIGIGIGSAAASLAVLGLVFILWRRYWRRNGGDARMGGRYPHDPNTGVIP